MIASKDRSGWIGASDTRYVVGKWSGKTFEKWWMEKLGLAWNHFSNKYTLAGTFYEHKILDALGVPVRKDHQIKLKRLRLRVNLDGDTKDAIYEVKTHQAEKTYQVTKYHNEQVQVQMFAKRCRKAYIVSYGLTSDDYDNYFNPIAPDRMRLHRVEYNPEFIEKIYLPKLRILSKYLKEGRWPVDR